jgi:DNA topoisomerase IA|tara:strand:+ start:22920 stop:23162 length:243 start_codon:yes stop_codon:yes gene_type:complete
LATAEEIRGHIADVRAARLQLLKGERVKEVWRDGRRLTFSEITMDGIEKALSALDQELADVLAADESRPRRRAIGIRYSN